MKKIFLEISEKTATMLQLMGKYKISRATASRARRRGYVTVGYHEPKLSPTLNTGRFGTNVILLSEEDRKMTTAKLMNKYGIKHEWNASLVRRRGWMRKEGLACDPLPEGGFPAFVEQEELIRECRTAACVAIRKTHVSKQEFEELIQAGMTRLLEVANKKKFVHEGWRWKMAYWACLRHLEKRVFKYFGEVSEVFEGEDVFNTKILSEEISIMEVMEE